MPPRIHYSIVSSVPYRRGCAIGRDDDAKALRMKLEHQLKAVKIRSLRLLAKFAQ